MYETKRKTVVKRLVCGPVRRRPLSALMPGLLAMACALCCLGSMAQDQPPKQGDKPQSAEVNKPVVVSQPPKLVEVSQPPQTPPPAVTPPPPSTHAPSGPRPVAQVVDKSSFDFGDVWVGEQVNHTFVIKNAGDAELEIVKVQPG